MKKLLVVLVTSTLVFISLCAAYPALASQVTSPSNANVSNIAAIGRAPIGDDVAFYGLGGFFRFVGGYFRFGITAALTVSINAPSNGASVSGSSVTLSATASGPNGV